jgi:hypothetical protein
VNNTKLVDNFDIFPESIDTTSSDQWFRSYDLCKLGEVLLKIHFWTNQATWTILDFKPTPNGKLEEP